MEFAAGEIVTRKSYDHDILFTIKQIQEDITILHGLDMRLEADAPTNDLVSIEKGELRKRSQERKERESFSYRLFKQDYQLMRDKREFEATDGYQEEVSYFRLPIKILHLDGDQMYLRKCIELYERLGLHVHGVHLAEKEMPFQIQSLIQRIQPQMVVITGHDAYSKNKGMKKELKSYRNSTYFVEAVRAAREVIPHLDQLIIFAGACQSHFESLIRAGANFASSPGRINIHALDPVYITAKIAYTPFIEKVRVWDVLRNTFTGEQGLGGIETKGLHRIGMPYVADNETNK